MHQWTNTKLSGTHVKLQKNKNPRCYHNIQFSVPVDIRCWTEGSHVVSLDSYDTFCKSSFIYNWNNDSFAGAILGIFTVIGLFMNILVIILFTKNKFVKTRTTHLLRSLAVSDGIMVLVGGTMFTINSVYHRWIFGEKGKNLLFTLDLNAKKVPLFAFN